MAETQYDVTETRLPKYCGEIDYWTRKKIAAEAEGHGTALYASYIAGYCEALKDAGILSEAHEWAAECEKRVRLEYGREAE